MSAPRRSTRVATRASSQAETPARKTPRKTRSTFGTPAPAALPALQTRESFAYGSPAMPAMPRGMLVGEGGKGIAEVLEVGVRAAVERDRARGDTPTGEENGTGRRSPSVQSAASTSFSHNTRSRARVRLSETIEEDGAPTPNAKQPSKTSSTSVTRQNISKSFNAERSLFGHIDTDSTVPELQLPSEENGDQLSEGNGIQPSEENDDHASEGIIDHASHAIRLAPHNHPYNPLHHLPTLPRVSRRALLTYTSIVALIGFLAYSIYTGSDFGLLGVIGSLFGALGSFVRMLGSAFSRPMANRPSSWTASQTPDYIYAPDLVQRVSSLEADVAQLQNKFHLHEQSLEKLKDLLPDAFLVPLNKATGSLEIPLDFWNALKEKIQIEYGTKKGKGSVWDAFLKKNDARVQRALHDESAWQASPNNNNIVTKEFFMKMLDDNYNKLSGEIQDLTQTYDKRHQSLKADTDRSASAIATRVATGLLKKHVPAVQLEAAAQANLNRNSQIALKKVNFFSTGLGAVVVPYLTSPTKWKPSSLLQRSTSELFGLKRPNPPVAALQSWEETGDCWCTPNERAQLAILLPQKIYPSEITIEHIPAAATLDIESAPKDMELWVEIKDDEARETVGRTQDQLLGVPEMPKAALDDNFVRVGLWQYDIHALDHVQTFTIDVNLENLGVPIEQVVVRAKNNWGGKDYTCLYRVRLHGKRAVAA
ncbi:MAG: hypothetical protein M1819_001264 [Sarea resinae]|nr:MAG: hypothetical protein M1819_001264 [Sarea resinae]